ncbi:MAG: hypothetical protein AAF801_01840 [Pseudomonadota bacterium]
MKRYLALTALCLFGVFGQAMPAAASGNAQLMHFATCAGRLSAQMEFQWMFDGPASEQTARHRAAMINLIDAVMDPDEGRTVLHWRISAKLAQSALLTRATFNDDAGDAAWAAQTAARLTNECTSIILS